MPFRARAPFLPWMIFMTSISLQMCINALSGQGSISTFGAVEKSIVAVYIGYQCPLGLGLHFYDLKQYSAGILANEYQCPFGLGLHFYPKTKWKRMSFFATQYQCPFGLGLHFYFHSTLKLTASGVSINALSGWGSISTVPLQKPRFYAVSGAYFCRHLSEYSDNDHFSCMLTIWTYLIVTSTTLAFFSITLILQFVIRYFSISPITNSLIPNSKIFSVMNTIRLLTCQSVVLLYSRIYSIFNVHIFYYTRSASFIKFVSKLFYL